MDGIDVISVWTAAGILLGFQLSVIRWRVDREREMEAAEVTVWLPWCDWLNLASMGWTALLVFALPAVRVIPTDLVPYSFVLSIIFLIGYAFALFGHYELYRPRAPKTRDPFPLQEKVPVITTVAIGAAYLVWWVSAASSIG